MKFITLLFIFFYSYSSYAQTELLSVKKDINSERSVFHFNFNKPVDANDIFVNFIRRTIEWDMKETFIRKDKKFVRFNNNKLSNIYISHRDARNIRVRLNLQENQQASWYDKHISFSSKGNELTLRVNQGDVTAKGEGREFNRMYAIQKAVQNKRTSLASQLTQSGGMSFDMKDVKSEKVESEQKPLMLSDVAEETKEAEKKSESEIPLNLEKSQVEKASSNPGTRALVGIMVLLMILAGGFLISKKINSKRMGSTFNQDSIKVISQKYLGPKRNLTMVRVAGEYMLLGVTDHNISLIKTLSLVEDELPQIEPGRFSEQMNELVQKDEEDNLSASSGLPAHIEIPAEEDSFSISSIDQVKQLMNEENA